MQPIFYQSDSKWRYLLARPAGLAERKAPSAISYSPVICAAMGSRFPNEGIPNVFLLSAPNASLLHMMRRGAFRSAKPAGRAKRYRHLLSDDKKWVAFKILTNQYLLSGRPYHLTTYVSSKEITHLIIKVLLTEAFVFLLLWSPLLLLTGKAPACYGGRSMLP